MESHATNFGARLRALIERKGITLVQFSEQFPLSESNVHNWLKRSAPPLEKYWPALAKFFGVSESYIAFGTPLIQEPPPSPNPLSIIGEGQTEELREFSFRLKSTMALGQITPDWIAGKMGIAETSVIDWIAGKKFPRSRECHDLANLLAVRYEWLRQGEGSPKASFELREEESPYGTSVREVPVISWTHAGVAATYEEMPKHWQGRVATTSTDRKAFALTIEGDSMEPKFFAGDRVICEPSHEPHNGKPVVAKFADDAVQLRIFNKLANGRIRLASLRPEIYATMDYSPKEFNWIYPVRELVRSV